MKKLLSFLHVDHVGFLELMLAFYPIVAGYQYGSIPMSLVWALLMDMIAFTRIRKPMRNVILVIVFSFVILHDVVVWMSNGMSITHLNFIISIIVFSTSIIIIAPALNFEKLVGSLYLIAFLVCGGIIYHFILLLSGRIITPIPLPFLPAPDISSRLFMEAHRPCSFFWEPAAFVTYMLIPLFISLVKKDWPLMLFFLFCIFLSTSTNGIILAPLMIAVYILFSRQNLSGKSLYAIILFAMCIWLFNSSLFDAGVDKLERTDASSNVRLSNGPWLVSQMPSEHIVLGIPYHSVNEYLSRGGVVDGSRIDPSRNFYLSDFWRVLVSYGIFGLILHLSVYFYFIQKDKTLIPYITILLVAQFSQSVAFQSTYVFQLCFILAYIRNNSNSSVRTMAISN